MAKVSQRSKLSQRVRKVSPSGIREFFDLLSSLEDVISLGVGEPDFVTPWRIREAAIHSLERGYTMYTSNYGLLELRREVAGYLESHYGLGYDPAAEILITMGVSEGVDLAMRAILDPGDEVIMADPCYVAYPSCVILAGGVPVFVPTRAENGFEIKASDIKRLVTEKTRAIMIGYPANPTGAVMTEQGLAEIARLVERYDLMVVSDEIYAQLVYGVRPVSFASFTGAKDRTILLGGFSKSHAMTGWRIGYACAPPEFTEAMVKIHQYTALCAPITGQMAAVEALRTAEGEVAAMVKEYDQRRRVIVKGLCDVGLGCFEPKGAFYAFPSIRVTGMTSVDFARKLLEEERVAVVPGSAFGKCGEGHVRCCYATSLPEIQEALVRMGRFVARHT
ncbi:MAG: aminotransferase class I/II-fold pyridoxal phosphate-dependent enzyme [Chloroflexota bacterium]